MSGKSLIAVAAACMAVAAANPAAATTVPFAVGPVATGPGTLIWVGVTNVGSTSVSFSNATISTSGQQTILTKAFDTCTNQTLAPGAICAFQAILPQTSVGVWVVMQATSTTGLRGAATITDGSGRPIYAVELK